MTTIKFRRDTSANWTSVNPIPAQGEPCYETDTGKLKIGNGSDNYTTLPYVSDGGGSGDNLPIASSTTLGGVKVGGNLSVTKDGVLSASSEAKTVKTPNGLIKLDNAGLHNDDNSRAIINRSNDQQQVNVGNLYEPTIIDGSSIKLNSPSITDKDGNSFLSGDTINGVKLYTDTNGNATVANVGWDSNRLSLTGGGCDLYDSDNRKIFGSTYSSGQTRTNWNFAHQSDTVRIANDGNSNSEGIIIKTPSGGTSPTIGYTYHGTDATLYGKEQSFLRTEDVDNSTIKIVDGKLTASGGSAPTNMVTTDTNQTISGGKIFSSDIVTKSGAKLTLNNVYNNKTIRLYTDRTGYLQVGCTGTSLPEFISIWDNSSNILDIAPTYLRTRTADGTKYEYINTQNIDTTYMKWNTSTEKLTVDKAAIAHLAMPSNTTVDLTLGASGATYTAPADGYLQLGKTSGASGERLALYGKVKFSMFSSAPGQALSSTIAMQTNESAVITYTLSASTNAFVFTYCNGTVPTS